jgi:hypothetical protein
MRSRSFCSRLAGLVLAAAASLVLPGCALGPDTEYGLSRGTSLNGTSVFAAFLRDRGHETRAAIRLSDELAAWAQGIVRFAPIPGPPDRDEAAWYRGWLAGDRDRWLIYVVRDFDAEHEYWKDLRDQLSDPSQKVGRDQAEEKRAEAADWVSRLPRKAEKGGDPKEWFVADTAVNPPLVCDKLGGLWARDIDAKGAALTMHEPLRADRRCILLQADDKPFVVDKSLIGAGRVLVIANGSFLLNETLVNPARRPLAELVADWPQSSGERIALLEGSFVLAGEQGMPTIWDLFGRVPALLWVAIQLGLAGVLAALARAPRLGRPRPDPASGVERPAAHAEALGALLERAGALAEARDLLDRYRLWRHPQTSRELSRVSARIRPRAHAGEAASSHIVGSAEKTEPAATAGSEPGRNPG